MHLTTIGGSELLGFPISFGAMLQTETVNCEAYSRHSHCCNAQDSGFGFEELIRINYTERPKC